MSRQGRPNAAGNWARQYSCSAATAVGATSASATGADGDARRARRRARLTRHHLGAAGQQQPRGQCGDERAGGAEHARHDARDGPTREAFPSNSTRAASVDTRAPGSVAFPTHRRMGGRGCRRRGVGAGHAVARRPVPAAPGHDPDHRHVRGARRFRHVLALGRRAVAGQRHLHDAREADQPQPAAAHRAAGPVRLARRPHRVPRLGGPERADGARVAAGRRP